MILGAMAFFVCLVTSSVICCIYRVFINRRANQPQSRRSGHGPDIRTDDSVAERRRRARYEGTTSLGDFQQSPSDANFSAASPPSYEEVSGNETNTYPRLTIVDVKSPPSNEISSMADHSTVSNGTSDREQDDSLEVSNIVESNSATELCDTD